MISRIEVIKGASSVLYGPNAEGGVINIITKKGGKDLSFTVQAEIGDYSSHRGVISAGGQKGIFNFWGTYENKSSDGWRVSDDYSPFEGTVSQYPGGSYNTVLQDNGLRENSDTRADNIWMRFGLVPTDNTDIYASIFSLDSERGNPVSVDGVKVFSDFSYFSRFSTYRDQGIDLSGRHRFSDQFQVRTALFYHDHEDQYDSYTQMEMIDKIAESTYRDSLAGVSVFSDYDLTDTITFSGALHYKRDTHEDRPDIGTDYASSVSSTFSIGLESTFVAPCGTEVVAGASLDYHDMSEAQDHDRDNAVFDLTPPSSDTAFNPMIGLSHIFNDATRVYGSVARKTRFPLLSGYYSQGGNNLDLKEEKNTNYTIGVSRPFLDNRMEIEVAGFYNDISDMIFTIDRDHPHENIGKASIGGMELSLSATPFDWLALTLNYTYTHGRNESDDRTSDYLIDIPKNMINFGFDWLVPGAEMEWSLNCRYRGETLAEIPQNLGDDEEWLQDSFTVDTRISRDFSDFVKWSNKMELYLELTNLFDENYWYTDTQPARGRGFMVGLKAEF